MVKVTTSEKLASEISKGASIEVDSGKYYLNSVKMASGLKITPFDDDNPPIIYMAAKHPSGPMLRGSSLKNITLEGVTFDGNFANQPGAVRGSSSLILFSLASSLGIDVIDCNWQNAAIDFMNFNACHDILIDGCEAHDGGHEFAYFRYNCYGVTAQNNKIKTRTNSSIRVSYGGYGFDIHDNEIYSVQKAGHTGPGMQIDKNNISDIEIWNNTFTDIYGSGIWMPGTGGTAKNIDIHHNTFKNVGKLPGSYLYSQAALTLGGWDGVEFHHNIIEDAWNGVRYYDRNGVKGSFNIESYDNIISSVKLAYDVRNSGCSITALRDEVSRCDKLTNGSVKITSGGRLGIAGYHANGGIESPIESTETATPVESITPVTPIENIEQSNIINEAIHVKEVKSTIIAMTPKGKLLHVTHDDNPATTVAVGNGTTMDVEVKLLVDDIYYASGKVALTLVKR